MRRQLKEPTTGTKLTDQEFLSHFDGVKGSGPQYTAQCPAHNDRQASLSIHVTDEGKRLVQCHAGCSAEDIMQAANLTMHDLFPAPEAETTWKEVAIYQYVDLDGKHADKVRLESNTGKKSFRWRQGNGRGGWQWNRQGVGHVLYNWQAMEGKKYVFVPEGEKDVDTLREHGLTAVCGADGASEKPGKWKPEYTEQLRGKHVAIIQDNDDVGKAFAIETARALNGVAASVRVLDLTTIWPDLPNHGDVSDMIAHDGENAVAAVRELANSAPVFEDVPLVIHEAKELPLPATDEWEAPIPFTVNDTPDFPTNALPSPIAAFVDALSISTQTPNEMGAILSLGVLATAFQKRCIVRVTSDYTEQLSLYTVAVAPPGERKSAVISALMAPVHAYETMKRENEAADVAKNQAERALLEKALVIAQGKAAKDLEDMESRKKMLDITEQLAAFKDIHPFRLVVDDTTPEKLIDIMSARDGCITIASGEGGLFDTLSGRYDKGANIDIYLKGHAGDQVSVERIGRAANHVPNPRLVMLLTIQPDVLNGLMGNSTFKGRGLCGRFLYAICKSKVGRRDITPPSVPEHVRDEYSQSIWRMLVGTDSGEITISPEADALRVEYAALVEKRLGREWEFMQDWGGKLVGAMIRIAGLLHAADSNGFPTREPINADEMARAIRIAEFLGPHAEAAYQAMGADERQVDAKYVLRQLEKERPTEITRSALLKLCEGRYRGRADALDPVMAVLSEQNYVRVQSRDVGYNNRKERGNQAASRCIDGEAILQRANEDGPAAWIDRAIWSDAEVRKKPMGVCLWACFAV